MATARSQQRYADWLRSDAGMTFGQWLKAGGEPEPDNTCGSCIGTGIGDPHNGSPCWYCRGTGEIQPQLEREYD